MPVVLEILQRLRPRRIQTQHREITEVQAQGLGQTILLVVAVVPVQQQVRHLALLVATEETARHLVSLVRLSHTLAAAVAVHSTAAQEAQGAQEAVVLAGQIVQPLAEPELRIPAVVAVVAVPVQPQVPTAAPAAPA